MKYICKQFNRGCEEQSLVCGLSGSEIVLETERGERVSLGYVVTNVGVLTIT